MYRLAVFLWLLCLGMQQCPAADTDISVHDDAGKQVTLASPARRVITLAPHLAEMVFAAGAGEFLVGTVEYSDYPPAAQSLPRVGDSFRIDVESILNMRPDVVLVWGSGNPKVLREHLADLQLNVVVLEPRQLEDIAEHLRIIGAITGKRKEAAEAARSYLEDLDELRREYADREKISVFYQISERPLYTINGEHVISALLRMCGGRNIFADLSALAPSVSTESVLQRNPEVILAGRFAKSNADPLIMWRRWSELAANKYDNFFSVTAETIARSTPRVIKGGREICEALDQARSNIAQQ